MKAYFVSLAVGLLVGVIYNLLSVRSPAPPVVALIGLLGMLIGEQLPPLAKAVWAREPLAVSWVQGVRAHVFGHLPRRETTASARVVQGPTVDTTIGTKSPS